MAIRKPTAPSERSAAMAEMLASAGQESKFKNGSLVEGTVSAVKDDDVFIDIGYKSVGSVDISEFGADAEVKVGDKVLTSKYSGTEVKVDGEECTIVRQGDILAVVED